MLRLRFRLHQRRLYTERRSAVLRFRRLLYPCCADLDGISRGALTMGTPSILGSWVRRITVREILRRRIRLTGIEPDPKARSTTRDNVFAGTAEEFQRNLAPSTSYL